VAREPDFEQRGGEFVVTIWRDWLTDEMLKTLGLNDRQRKGVALAKGQGQISNQDYQKETGAIRKTAARDLEELVRKGLLEKKGAGRGVHYVLARKWDKNGTSGT
jgi:ATP-dependent DNA helicase RecG